MSDGSDALTPHDETVLKISNALDQHIYASLYKRSANQLEFSLSGLAHMAKVTKKLVPIKVYSFVFGIFCLLGLLKVCRSSPVKGVIYLLLACDAFHISYNSYERAYASIAGKNSFRCTLYYLHTRVVLLLIFSALSDWIICVIESLARRTLSSTKELGSVVMSFFTCGKKAKDSNQNDVLKALSEDVRWKFLIDGTFTEFAYKKVSKAIPEQPHYIICFSFSCCTFLLCRPRNPISLRSNTLLVFNSYYLNEYNRLVYAMCLLYPQLKLYKYKKFILLLKNNICR